LKQEEPASAVERRVRDRAIRHAEAVVEAMAAIAIDPAASARDRATAGSSVLRAAGLYAVKTDALDKEPHEMTPAELATEVARLQAARESAREADRSDDGASLFD
jgi:hypothetical protein